MVRHVEMLRPPLEKEDLPRRKCPVCGKEFTPNRKWQAFDTKPCQQKYYAATHPRISVEQLKGSEGKKK